MKSIEPTLFVPLATARAPMHCNRLKQITVLFALTVSVIVCPAHAAALKIGDSAPKLAVSKWLQGEPVKEFARDKVYLVEFWATWCGPCLESIPHLDTLHRKFKDQGLVVIGQNVMEQDPDRVAPFVKKMGNDMSYRVALDTDDSSMARTWMEAAGEDGIPVAFAVDKRGIIAWIGHPLELKENAIEQLLAGKFDVAKAAVDDARKRKVDEQLRTLLVEFNRLARNAEWDAAEAVLNDAGKLWPEEHRKNFGLRRFEFLLDRRDEQRAYKLAAELSEAHPDDAMLHNALAWTIATKDGLAARDLNLAEKIARRAWAVMKNSDAQKAEILDTLARVLFLKDERKPAIEFQERAVAFAADNRKAHFQKTLDDYKAGRVPNETRLRALENEIRESIQKKEWSKAETALADFEKASPEPARNRIDSHRFRILTGRGDFDGAAGMVERLTRRPEENAMLLNDLAWEIAVREGVTAREIDLAEIIARRANDATKASNAEILDTLARLLFLKDQKMAAIDLQEKAVSFARGRRKMQFQETLDSYRADKLPKAY